MTTKHVLPGAAGYLTKPLEPRNAEPSGGWTDVLTGPEAAQSVPTPSPIGDSERPPTTLPTVKPRWQRPADSKVRQRVKRVLALKLAGWTHAEIAKKFKVKEGTIGTWLRLASRNGWLSPEGEFLDPAEELAYVTAHKIVRNVNKALDGEDLTKQQHEMTIEAAKGVGMFKQHQAIKNDGPALPTMVAVRIEFPPGIDPSAPPQLPEGGIAGGAPAYIEAEVVK